MPPPAEPEINPDPDKFVRTFATDAAAVQSGQVPAFENKGGSSPSVDALVPKPESQPDPLKAAPPPEEMLNLDNRTQSPIDVLAPAKPAPPTVTPIHTYKSDFADEVKAKNASQADILAAEQDATPVAEVTQQRKQTDWLVILAFVLIFVGVASAGAAYYWRLTHPTTVAAAVEPTAPIFVDSQQEISGVGGTLMNAIAQAVPTLGADNTIRLLYTADSATSTSIFNDLAPSSAPDILLRNIQAQGSMAGIVNVNGIDSPFFILSVESYSDTFSGMLSWEPYMATALAPLYPPYPTATTTETSKVPAPTFKDGTILNHDVRILTDAEGNTILVYGYFDQQTLVIARDQDSFSAVLDRLTNSSSTS